MSKQILALKCAHPMRDWSPRLRLNAAACVKARTDFNAKAQAAYEVRGGSPVDFDALPLTEKQRLVKQEWDAMQQMPPRPVLVPVVGIMAHLDDAQEAAEDLTAALQDALKVQTTYTQDAEVIALLETVAQVACKVAQLRAKGSAA